MSRLRLAFMRCPLVLATIITVAAQVGCFSADDSERWEKAIADLKAPNLTVRQAAASSLVDLAVQAASEKRTRDQAEVLERRLNALAEVVRNKGEDPGVRAELVHALGIGEFGSLAAGTTLTLIEVLVDETDQFLKCEAGKRNGRSCRRIGPAETVSSSDPSRLPRAVISLLRVNASPRLSAESQWPWRRCYRCCSARSTIPPRPRRIAAVSTAGSLARTDKRAALNRHPARSMTATELIGGRPWFACERLERQGRWRCQEPTAPGSPEGSRARDPGGRRLSP